MSLQCEMDMGERRPERRPDHKLLVRCCQDRGVRERKFGSSVRKIRPDSFGFSVALGYFETVLVQAEKNLMVLHLGSWGLCRTQLSQHMVCTVPSPYASVRRHRG
jgi:hypothetical protein